MATARILRTEHLRKTTDRVNGEGEPGVAAHEDLQMKAAALIETHTLETTLGIKMTDATEIEIGLEEDGMRNIDHIDEDCMAHIIDTLSLESQYKRTAGSHRL